MKESLKSAMLMLTFGVASMMMASVANSEEWPIVGGDYWEVTGIVIKDGGDLKYSNWLADEWQKDAEFSKSKGWIKDYKMIGNVHNRSGEADLYLIRIRETIVSGTESEKRAKEYMEWRKKSLEALDSENGNRAEYREVMGTQLLQELTFRK
ncbi:MAG: hypothetical protein V7700_14285 [Halioglobus sp.]